ncbi:hypothetical protein HWN40_13255 [Methanolobus zinderi]|uniref:DUF4145 domain-containing protein n=1 Tax=Methanolobus zinderi TaxID=536044 RepID=A0A7D5EAA7_9EURY|nr:hypothetical protein [Methanolobus zinderi]QLC51117.1 hypothetical protein HWN40_13255 [Methanolobus zinderi]
MNNLDIDTYIQEAEAIEGLYLELIENTAKPNKRTQLFSTIFKEAETKGMYAQPLPVSKYEVEEEICETDLKTKPLQRQVLRKYEIWYEICRMVVQEYLGNEETGKYELFCKQYKKIKDLIKLSTPNSEKECLINNFMDYFDIQVNILYTIKPIVSLRKNNYKKLVSADLLNSELDGAEILYEKDFVRPAGIIAGIVLERYLKTLCELNEIELDSKDTLYPMAQKLRKSDKVPYFDLAIFKSIDHLATLRNKCAHPKEEPKKHEVRELIDKTKKITFMAFS